MRFRSITELAQPSLLPRLGIWVIDLEHAQPGRQLGSPLAKRIQSGTEDHVLPDTALELFEHPVLDEAGARDDRDASHPAVLRDHIPAVTPVVAWIRELEANRVVEDVGLRIDLDVQRAP